MSERPAIDVYPVGWLAAFQRSRRMWKHHQQMPRGRWEAVHNMRYELKRSMRWIRTGNVRALKNQCNGYLAEPVAFPEALRRCGSGWTKRRALRSLSRELRRAEALRRHPNGKGNAKASGSPGQNGGRRG